MHVVGIVYGQQQLLLPSPPSTPPQPVAVPQPAPRAQTSKYPMCRLTSSSFSFWFFKLAMFFSCVCYFASFVLFEVSRVEKEPRRKDRSRSKSPFRSFRWKKGSSKSSGAVSDDETATLPGIYVCF